MHRLQGAAASDARADERPRLGHALVSRKRSGLASSRLAASFLRSYVRMCTLDNGNWNFIIVGPFGGSQLRETAWNEGRCHMAFQQRVSTVRTTMTSYTTAYGVIETRLINGEE